MLTTSSAFATHWDAHGVHPVMVAIDGSTVYDTLSIHSQMDSIQSDLCPIRLVGPMSVLVGKQFPLRIIAPNLDFHNHLDILI